VSRPRAADDFATIRARMEEPAKPERLPTLSQKGRLPTRLLPYPSTSGVTSVVNHSKRSMLSAMDWPRQSKTSSCTPIAAKRRMSPAISSGAPENGRRDPSGDGMPVS
jgi:hypothetical protein